MNDIDKISTASIRKAQDVFEKFRLNLNTDQEKAGAVQAFEFCYELSWKFMKKALLLRGMEVGSPKDTFRKAFEEKIIEDPEVWFEFQRRRNLATHTYNQENLNLIIDVFDHFSQEFQKLIAKLENLQ